MRKDKSMSLEEHIETANDLAIATHHLRKIFDKCQEHYPKSGNLMKLLYKVCPGVLSGIFRKIQRELDSEYRELINDKEFEEHGNIYYNLYKRYEKLKDITS